jgi:hypothetical protein
LIITDPYGHVVTTIGFFADGAALNYGLTNFDPLGNVGSWVGVQTELPLAITAATNVSPSVITITGHPYVDGDTVLIQGATGNTAINGIRIVENTTTNTFTTTDLGGTPINGNGTYTGNGTATRYYAGGFFETIGIGGTTGFAGAKIRAFADGTVQITNALIKLISGSGEITLDPATAEIIIQDIPPTQTTILGSGGITQSKPGISATSTFDPGVIQLVTGVKQINLDTTGALTGNFDLEGINFAVGGTIVVDQFRNVNANAYFVNGTPGISGSITYVKTVAVDFTLHTVTTTTGTLTFTSGIITGST